MDENNNPEVVQETTQQPTQTREDSIWRRKYQQEEEARRQAEYRMRELEQRVQSISNPQPTTSDEDDLGVENDEYVQAKHVRLNNKKFKTTLSSTQQELADLKKQMALMEARVATSSLNDFEQVVSEENMAKLAREFPDDYETIMANPNLRGRSKTAYNMIKRYGIMGAQQDSTIEDRLAANKKKPQSVSSTSPQAASTPLTQVGDYQRRVLTEEQKAFHRREIDRLKNMG